MRRRLTREESAERTRRRLLEAAELLFVKHGFHATSLESVAEQAGFSKGAVYSRFESKADLFLALLEERRPQTVRAFAGLVAEARSASEFVAAYRRWWEARLSEDPAWSLVLIEFWTSAGRDRALRVRFAESHEQLMRALAELIDDAAERLGVQLAVSSLDLARVTTALGRGLQLERLLNPEAFEEGLTAWAFDSFAGPGTDLTNPLPSVLKETTT